MGNMNTEKTEQVKVAEAKVGDYTHSKAVNKFGLTPEQQTQLETMTPKEKKVFLKPYRTKYNG